jgi:hypothetical protein
VVWYPKDRWKVLIALIEERLKHILHKCAKGIRLKEKNWMIKQDMEQPKHVSEASPKRKESRCETETTQDVSVSLVSHSPPTRHAGKVAWLVLRNLQCSPG